MFVLRFPFEEEGVMDNVIDLASVRAAQELEDDAPPEWISNAVRAAVNHLAREAAKRGADLSDLQEPFNRAVAELMDEAITVCLGMPYRNVAHKKPQGHY